MKSDKIFSQYLDRPVSLTLFRVDDEPLQEIIVINDGQDLSQMGLLEMLLQLKSVNKYNTGIVGCAAAPGDERKQEYGVQWASDYHGRGAKAKCYSQFILKELKPYIDQNCNITPETSFTIAGWSLGGLSAIDIAWHAPQLFSKVGIFSGSLWWRNPKLITDDTFHRLMHHKVKNAAEIPNLKFWFQAGTEDEKADRNKNGIIDVIDDTLDLLYELEQKGYKKGSDYHFHIEEGGKHDVQTWSKVMPLFLNWLASKARA